MKGSLPSRVLSGLFVGTHGRDTNILAMTSDGVIKGTTVHRMSETEKTGSSVGVETADG